MHYFKKAGLLLVLTSWIFLVSSTRAQETGINLSVSPAFINLATDPETSVSSQIHITNNNNFKETLIIGISRFQQSQGGGGLRISPVDKDDEFVKWLSIPETEFVLDSNQSKTIPFTITPAKDSALGYYYALVVRRKEDKVEKNQTSLRGAAAVPLLLEVRSAGAKRELQLVDFKTSNAWYEYPPIEFSVTVKNTGNIHVIPAGDIFIDGMGGKDRGILKANGGRSTILPAATRVFTTAWDDAFIVKGKAWDFTRANKLRIGKYSAHLLLVYDNGKRDIPLEAVVSFWVIPWKLVGAVLVIFYLALMGLKQTVMTNIRKLKKL